MSAKPSPRSSSRLRSAAPSSSEVEPRSVAKRQCSVISPSRTAPKWVWVLPTSTTRSTGGLCGQRKARAPPAPPLLESEHGERVRERLPRRRRELELELEQRDQHE